MQHGNQSATSIAGWLTLARNSKQLNKAEITAAFQDDFGQEYGPILSPTQFAKLMGVGRATIYEWLAKGRLKGASRKRGKHVFIWRDSAIDLIFNGPNWSEGVA